MGGDEKVAKTIGNLSLTPLPDKMGRKGRQNRGGRPIQISN